MRGLPVVGGPPSPDPNRACTFDPRIRFPMPEAPIDLPPATAEGTFAKTPLVQVLVYVLERSLTGTIEVTHPDGPWASILVLDGQPSKGRTSEPIAYLGSVLHELGYIDDTTLNASLASMAKERKLHGQILRAMGKITDDQLTDGLRAQLLRKVEHLFDWPADTKFAYYDGFDALHTYGGDDQVQLDPLPLVWSAIRTQPPWEHVHAALTRVGTGAMRLTPTAQIERFEFSKEERAAADLLRMQPMRVHELVGTKLLGASRSKWSSSCSASRPSGWHACRRRRWRSGRWSKSARPSPIRARPAVRSRRTSWCRSPLACRRSSSLRRAIQRPNRGAKGRAQRASPRVFRRSSARVAS